MRGLNETRRAIAAVLAAVVLTLAAAGTASAVVPGGIHAELANGCVSTASGCATTLSTTIFNREPVDVAVSPDNANVYVTTAGNGLLVFARAANGQLSFMQCLREAATAQCGRLTGLAGLSGPSAVVVSPGGDSVYVANTSGNRVLAFDRLAGGALALKAGGGCVSTAGGPGLACTFARSMTAPRDLAIAGDVLYVASATTGSVTALRIGAGGGIVEAQDSGAFASCINPAGTSGCARSDGIAGAHSLAVQGGRLYVGATRSIVTLARDPSTGLLARSSCVANAAPCAVVPELAANVTDIAVGNEGQVYAAMPSITNAEGVITAPARVVTFDPTGNGLTRRAGATGCVSNSAAANCTAGRELAATAPQLLATPDGQDVYVAGSAVVELNKAAGGALSPRNDARGCVRTTALANACSAFAGLGAPTAVAIAPDGRHVYALTSNKIVTLRRDSSGPICGNTAVTVPHGFQGPIAIPCFDPDGDPLTFTTITPPTLGSLGAFDHGAANVIYAAPQGQNGSSAISFRATYTSFGTFVGDGSVQVNVVGAPVVLPGGIDADGDGFTAGQDCNDNNPAIRPGATEIKGNNIDENCDGVAEPFPTIASGVAHTWAWKKRGTTFTLKTLQITQQFPKGWKVQVKCSGKKCPFKTKSLKASKVKKSASSVIASLSRKQRKFRVGQTLEIWVQAPNFNTKVARITFKKGKQPAIVPYCVLPGSAKVQKTCS